MLQSWIRIDTSVVDEGACSARVIPRFSKTAIRPGAGAALRHRRRQIRHQGEAARFEARRRFAVFTQEITGANQAAKSFVA
jgi:hypothetical protein